MRFLLGAKLYVQTIDLIQLLLIIKKYIGIKSLEVTSMKEKMHFTILSNDSTDGDGGYGVGTP